MGEMIDPQAKICDERMKASSNGQEKCFQLK